MRSEIRDVRCAQIELRHAAVHTACANQAGQFLAGMRPYVRQNAWCPVRAVRIAAARALAGTDLLALTPEHQTALVKATAELVAPETELVSVCNCTAVAATSTLVSVGPILSDASRRAVCDDSR